MLCLKVTIIARKNSTALSLFEISGTPADSESHNKNILDHNYSEKLKLSLYLEDRRILIIQPGEPEKTTTSKKHKRCFMYPSTKDNKYNTVCAKCNKTICKTQTYFVCQQSKE